MARQFAEAVEAVKPGGIIARAVAEDGGARVQGIMPAFLQALEAPVSAEEKLIITPHLQERKAVMLQMSDAFVVLPGGLGTFDEFFDVATEAQLALPPGPDLDVLEARTGAPFVVVGGTRHPPTALPVPIPVDQAATDRLPEGAPLEVQAPPPTRSAAEQAGRVKDYLVKKRG